MGGENGQKEHAQLLRLLGSQVTMLSSLASVPASLGAHGPSPSAPPESVQVKRIWEQVPPHLVLISAMICLRNLWPQAHLPLL